MIRKNTDIRILTWVVLLVVPSLLHAQGYQMNSIPEKIRSGEARMQYVVKHYWDAYDFCDTTLLRADYAEQAMVDYLALLRNTAPEQQQKSWKHFMKDVASEPKTERYFHETAVRYLEGRESPLYSPEMLEIYLQQALESKLPDIRSRADFQLRLLQSNRVGTRVADFKVVTQKGAKKNLYDVLEEKPALLLFYDPDCKECQYAIYRLRHNITVRDAVRQGTLQVVAVCVGDDEKAWKVNGDDMPQTWCRVFDATDVRAAALFDLTDLPRLYLLDENHQVVERNMEVNRINEGLAHTRARNIY